MEIQTKCTYCISVCALMLARVAAVCGVLFRNVLPLIMCLSEFYGKEILLLREGKERGPVSFQ